MEDEVEWKEIEDAIASGYEDFGDYWHIKQNKLREQSIPARLKSTIFSGVCIYVNGRTMPTQTELKDSICEHGGSHEYVLNRSRVTHIVATVLPTGKLRNLSDRDVIVRPEWIVESIKENRKLDVSPFRLYAQMDHRQDTLKTSDPSFLQSYYQSSRLHHLSTWREELKRYAADLMSAKPAPSTQSSFVLHVDLDCFFASVSLISRPDLHDRPVVVAHSTAATASSTGDVSSCNYPARSLGIRNGMWLKEALELCPSLAIVPYEFEQYNQVSRLFYQILASHSAHLQAVSCDEAYIQTADVTRDSILERGSEIRREIRELCKCPASIGISTNALLARIATKKAKPDGLYFLPAEEAIDHLSDLSVSDLPGVGWALRDKLQGMFSASKCADLFNISLAKLQKEFGPNNGKMLWERCRGIDKRPFPPISCERKSVGTEVSWGVRLADQAETRIFLMNLSTEVAKRLANIDSLAQKLTLKVMIAREGVGSPRKHLGHGVCDSVNKTKSFQDGVKTADSVFGHSWSLLQTITTSWSTIRGIGIFLTELKAIASKSAESRPRRSNIIDLMNVNLEDRLAKHGFSLDVFQELPKHIQQEILSDLGISTATEPFSMMPSTPLKNLPCRAKRKKNDSQLTLTQLWRQPADSNDELPPGIDREYLLALPSSIRRELIHNARDAPPKSPTKSASHQDEWDLTAGESIDLEDMLPAPFENKVRDLKTILVLLQGQNYSVLALEDFLSRLVGFNAIEPLVTVLKLIADVHPALVERIQEEYGRRFEQKKLKL